MSPDPTTSTSQHDADYMHIVVTDPATGHLLDFEIIPVPLTMTDVTQALQDLRARHVDRQAADDEDSRWLPSESELVAHKLEDVDNVIELPAPTTRADVRRIAATVICDDTDTSIDTAIAEVARDERRRVEAQRHAKMVQRLQAVAPLWDVSPYRPAGGEQGSRS